MVNTGNTSQYRDRRRAWIDRLVHRIVAGSGLLVLAMLLLIFFYLLYVVTPLFLSPTVNGQKTVPRQGAEPSLALGLSDNGKIGFRIDSQGYGEFISFAENQPMSRIQLVPALSLLAQSQGERQVYALSQPDGRLVFVQPILSRMLSRTENRSPVWDYPLGEQAYSLGLPAQPLRYLAVAAVGEKQVVVAAIGQENALIIADVDKNGVRQRAQITLPAGTISQLLLTPDGQQVYLLSGKTLTLWQVGANALTLREERQLQQAEPLHLALLSGGRSLLVQAADGRISQWFDVPGEKGATLTETRQFPHVVGESVLLATEMQRRVFATLSAQGELSLFASKQSHALLTQTLPAHAQTLAFSPRGSALLVETAQGWHRYRVDNPYPDIGWRGLWQKLWYENYPEPAYIWQSTSADDSYQAKFSMMPLMLGTMKAAIYAMLFATPLALSAAIYTACFMSPTLRRWIKPTLEIMGALPTVVVGLIAAIWLAPHFATYLSAILVMPILWMLAVLGCGWLIECLPTRWRVRFPAGWDVLFLIPTILLTFVVGCWLAPRMENWVLGQPLYQWLGDDFVQRNTLVAGVALGFALIPLIFSLAEDALFSVPARLSQGSLALGATAWQTLWRVVLPSASAGIFAALMLSFGRAVGETMIVLMATGNTPIMDEGLLQGLRSLAANIAIEMPEAVTNSGHYRVLFLTALTLFVFTFIVNTLAETIRQRLRQRYRDEGENA
ncbi:ABC transporter permease subunit [Pectobacterium brasiliense]|uniref:ABC transporter permease subunit n=1 Tax=Pectobacterium brasiliense TaxID=180957 RepID=UPI000650CD77|nr:ABC transporter permease subunit [Pectobacterium brasiliense]KMK81269.1 binding-protein-dependent transport systems inner membrane component [Pectobacterium brasiliense ICMP 19477]